MAEPGNKSVRVGLGLERFGRRPATSAEDLWHSIGLMETIGYDSVWLSDTATGNALAPLPALAAIAARTERLKLGTSVLVVPPRNPVLLAKEMATIDAISGGRFLPAFGLGVNRGTEREALGVEPGERVARLEEALEIIRLLWPGDPVSYEGRFASLDDVTLRPKPTRSKLEIWLGGTAPKALQRIGRIADGWLASFTSPAEFAVGVATIRDAAAAAGRTIDYDHYGMTLFAAPDDSELTEPARALLGRRPEIALDDHVAIGSAALRTLLERYREAGAMKFVVIPIATAIDEWLAEMWEVAVQPVEAAG